MAENVAKNSSPGGKGPKKRRSITVTLSIPTIVSFFVTMSLGVIGVFILGVIVGRGHDDSKLGSLIAAQTTPQTQSRPAEAPAVRVAPVERQQTPTQTDQAQQAAGGQNTAQPDSGVIPAENLQYRDNLRTPPAQRRPAQPAQTAQPTQTTTQTQQAPAQPVQTPVQAPVQAPTQPAQAPAQTPAQTPTQPAQTATAQGGQTTAARSSGAVENENTVYNYVYQVAAFRDEKQAHDLKNALTKNNVSAVVERQVHNNTTWYRVLTPFQGTPASTGMLKDTLGRMGIDKIILKSKKPAN